jgi:5'-nucleotidase
LHGVDLLLGGHDHLYFIPKGADAWEGFDHTQPQLGGEEDKGDVLIIKSGNDFRDLSEIELEVKHVPDAEVRKWVVSKVTGESKMLARGRHAHNSQGKRRVTEPSMPKSEKMSELLKKLLASVGSSLKAPVCQSTVQLDLRGYHIRTTEVCPFSFTCFGS